MLTSCCHSEKNVSIILLSNIDRVTIKVTDFGEFNIKFAVSKLLYEISPKSLHEFKSFQGQTIKWRYINFIAANLRCHGNEI